MADPNIVNPDDSSYSLPQPTTATVGGIPTMPLERTLPRQTSTGLARGVQQLGTPNVYVDSGNEQIIVSKTDGQNVTTPQVLMGNQVNKGEGFYVTKPGVDVTKASNDADFIFNSNQNVFKIVDKLPFTIPAYSVSNPGAGNWGSNGVQVNIPHGLTYAPLVNAYRVDGSSSTQLSYTSVVSASAGTFVMLSIYVTVNETNVEILSSAAVYGNTSFSTGDVTGICYVLQETAS